MSRTKVDNPVAPDVVVVYIVSQPFMSLFKTHTVTLLEIVRPLFILRYRLVVGGYKTPVDRDALWNLNRADTSAVIVPEFEKQWSKQCIKANQSVFKQFIL